MPTSNILIVCIACASVDEAAKLARLLVEQKLAACVQTHPVRSTYVWQGQIETADEVMLTAKTISGKLEALEAAVKAYHSYEVPEIIATRAEWVNADYANWVIESLG